MARTPERNSSRPYRSICDSSLFFLGISLQFHVRRICPLALHPHCHRRRWFLSEDLQPYALYSIPHFSNSD